MWVQYDVLSAWGIAHRLCLFNGALLQTFCARNRGMLGMSEHTCFSHDVLIGKWPPHPGPVSPTATIERAADLQEQELKNGKGGGGGRDRPLVLGASKCSFVIDFLCPGLPSAEAVGHPS